MKHDYSINNYINVIKHHTTVTPAAKETISLCVIIRINNILFIN